MKMIRCMLINCPFATTAVQMPDFIIFAILNTKIRLIPSLCAIFCFKGEKWFA